MTWKSTTEHYGRVAILIHWISALLIIGMLAAGITASNTADPAQKAAILRVHAPTGMLVLALTVLRIVWWLAVDRKPEQVAGQAAWQRAVSVWVHRAFYVLIIGMVASGVTLMSMSGAGEIIFAGEANPADAARPLPDFDGFAAYAAHGIMAVLLGALLVLHVLAALYHQFIRGDRLLARMGIGRKAAQ
jgi:cytochrome b561